MAVNKIKKFGTTASGDNTYTDEQIALYPYLDPGIPFGAVAETDILNAMLRQTTVIVHALAEVILARQTTPTDVTSVDTDLVTRLEEAIQNLSKSVLDSNKIDNASSPFVGTALSTAEPKVITERKVAGSFYNGVDKETAGWALDARQGKALKTLITALEEAGYQTAEDVNGLIKVKLDNTGGDTSITTLTLWVGTQAQYDALASKTGKFCIIKG